MLEISNVGEDRSLILSREIRTENVSCRRIDMNDIAPKFFPVSFLGHGPIPHDEKFHLLLANQGTEVVRTDRSRFSFFLGALSTFPLRVMGNHFRWSSSWYQAKKSIKAHMQRDYLFDQTMKYFCIPSDIYNESLYSLRLPIDCPLVDLDRDLLMPLGKWDSKNKEFIFTPIGIAPCYSRYSEDFLRPYYLGVLFGNGISYSAKAWAKRGRTSLSLVHSTFESPEFVKYPMRDLFFASKDSYPAYGKFASLRTMNFLFGITTNNNRVPFKNYQEKIKHEPGDMLPDFLEGINIDTSIILDRLKEEYGS